MRARFAAVRAVCRRWLLVYMSVATLVLGASATIGFLLGSAIPVDSLPMATDGGTGGFFPPLTTTALAINNLTAMVVLLFGAVSIGLLSVVGLVLNGLLIGAIVSIAVHQLEPLVVFMLIAPHGLLEVPALLIAAAIGLRFGHVTVRYLRGMEEKLVTVRDLREAGWLVAVAAVLILIGAYIEANFTIELAERIAGEPITRATK